MTDRAHIFNGNLVKLFSGERGTVVDGQRRLVSPPVIGWQMDGHKVVPATETITDTSTGTVGKVTSDTGWVVALDESEVTRTITVRDMTSQEIDSENDSIATSEADQIIGEIQRRAMNILFSLSKKNTPSLTLAKFVNDFEGTLGDKPITRQMFIDYIKDNRI